MAKVLQMRQARQKHEDPLDLGSLPLVSPPRDGWPAVEAALHADRRRLTLRVAGGSLAAAVTVALAIGVAWHAAETPDSNGIAGTELAAQPMPPAVEAPPPATLDSLVSLSQGLENRLRLIRMEAGDLPADRLVYRVELEDLIVQVDAQLSQEPDSLPLWMQRVNLLMDLERLYENSLRRDYQRMASL